MDSGLGSDEERRGRTTKEQKQRHNQQLLTGCFLNGGGIGINTINTNSINSINSSGVRSDDGSGENDTNTTINGDVVRRSNQERRQGALLFQTSIPQYSTVHMPECSPPDTPYNSIVQIEDEQPPQEIEIEQHKPPLRFYVDLSEVEDPEPPPIPPPSTSMKKNIFSMVIDFQAPKKDMPKNLRRSRGGSAASSSSNGDSNGVKNGGESSSSNGHQSNGETSDCNEGCSKNLNLKKGICINEENKDEDEIRISTESVKHSNSIEPETKQFVKLSDLERQSPIVDLTVLPRMTRSIPESSWVEEPLLMSRSMGYRSAPRPLPPEPSEMSDSSGSDTGQCQKRLGTDLLKMFLEEIGPDVHVKVAGRIIKAHRCILVSRCQYFAGSLSGHHDDVINLRGFTYEVVHFAMCHIYSGASHVPDSISLEELAALADLLGLEGLKEVVAHALKNRHCHNFHKPCPGCLTGIPEVLPLAAAHGLDELYQRCLQWLTMYYERTWPTRAFVSMPKELREKCLQQHLVHMTNENVLSTILSCDKLLGNLPQLSWCDPVIQLGLQLADASQLFLRQHLSTVLSSNSFQSLDSEMIQRLEEQFLNAAETIGPEQACKSYGRCHKMLDQIYSKDHIELLRKLDKQLEQSLAARADKATRCPAWQRLEPALRARIREAARPSRLPRASSSDSSRTSSPATSRAPAGSPSLRRSLLLAARAPQIPPSPSITRRNNSSSLTRPTQSSAAKSTSAPSKNIKQSIVKSPTTKQSFHSIQSIQKNGIKLESNRKDLNKNQNQIDSKNKNDLVRKELAKKESFKREPIKAKPIQTSTRTPTVTRRVLKDDNKDIKSPNRSPLNISKSPSKTNVVKTSKFNNNNLKSPSKSNTSSTCKSPIKTSKTSSNVASPSKSTAKSPSKPVQSGMTRSGTFLMDEPTVLGRQH